MAVRIRTSARWLARFGADPVFVWQIAKLSIVALALVWSLAADLYAQQAPPQFRFRRGVPGQPMIEGSEEQTAEGVFHGDRETRKQLKKAKKLLEDKRFSEALPLLDDILESSQDYFDITEENQSARNGLKSEAQRLIGEQSAEGLSAYEMLYGAKAERMLADALAAGDLSAVAEVARRYFHTHAGYDATLFLGRHQLDHNQPLAAALCFQRLLASPAAEKLEPGLSVMLAGCWLRGGLDNRARQTLMDLKKRDAGATLKIAGKDVKLFAAADEVHALSWLAENFGQQQPSNAVAAANWAMVRGNPARNAVSAGGIPLLNPRWRSSIAPTREVKEAMATARQESADRNLTTIPVMQPLAVADCVLARAPSGLLFGIDFRTGKKVWDNHLHIQQPTERPPSMATIRGPGMIVNVPDPFSDHLWENATCGTLSSDGQYVFEVEEIPDSSGAGMREMTRRQWMLRGNGMAGLGLDHPTNKLAAYEPSTEGKIKWCVGGEVTDFEPMLVGAYFLGPPLPLFGRLYVLAEIKGEIRLVVLDGKTGKLGWSQQLASPEDPNVIGSGFRRTTGVSPSYADGILICPTSAGAVVGVDIANRMLLWGYEYPRSVQTPQQQQVMAIRMGAMVNMNPLPSFLGDRWADATATIADGCVILTPVESDHLYCLSLLDGKQLWKAGRDEYIFVAGIEDGKVVLVGRKQIQAFQLTNGKPAWPNPLLLPQGSAPSGRGFLSRTHYFLPLSSAEVASIDLATGKIDARVKSRKGVVPGNLICYKGTVISQGIDSVDEFFQLEPLEQSVAKALAANPNDPAALADRGNAELDEGKIAEAIVDVRKSYEQKPVASTRELLVEALLADLNRNFAASRGTIEELDKLVVLDSERTAFLRTLSEGLDKSGDRLGSLEAYLKLIDLSSGQADTEVVSNQLSVRRDRWVRARLDRLYAAATGDERTKFDAAVSERLNKALAAKQAKDLRRFLAFFGFHPASDEAREQLFAQLGGQESWIERESLLDELQRSADPVRRRAAIAQMGAFLNDANKYDEAAVFYRRLAREFPDVVCMSGKTGKQLVESLPAESPLKRALIDAAAWPEGSVRRDAAEIRGFRQNPARPFPITWRGARPEFLDTVTVAFQQQEQLIVGHDGVGRERFRVQINSQNRLPFQQISPELNFVSAQGHLLLVNLGSELLAIDTLRSQGNGNPVLWAQELTELGPNMFNGQPIQAKEIPLPWGASRHVPAPVAGGQTIGIVGPLLDRCVLVERSRDLTAFDPVTGETLWSRRGIEPGSEIFGDEEALVIVPPDIAGDSVQVTILRSMDGEELGTRKLPKSIRRWAYCGRRCLAGRVKSDGRLSFVLSDPWKEKELVLATFKSGVKATLIGDDAAAFLEPSGRFLMVALADGSHMIDQQLEPEDALDNIVVQRTPDQYVLFANRASRGSSPNMPTPQGMVGLDSGMALANGHIYSFDRASGKPLWPVPALVKNYHVLLGQGVDLPLLVLLHWRPATGVSGSGEAKSSLLCLDRRSGRAVWKEDLGQPANFFNCELSGNRERQTVTVSMPTQALTLRFTNDPVPPEPPYQAGLLTEQSPLGQNPAAAILKAIGGATREIGGDQDPFDRDDGK